jgi:hypothetical protein
MLETGRWRTKKVLSQSTSLTSAPFSPASSVRRANSWKLVLPAVGVLRLGQPLHLVHQLVRDAVVQHLQQQTD